MAEDNIDTNESVFPVGSRILIEVSDDFTRQTWAYNNGTHVILETYTDTSRLLEVNQRKQIDFNMHGKRDEAVHVASVPLALKGQWDREQRSEEDIVKALNSPEFAWLRTTNPSWRV